MSYRGRSCEHESKGNDEKYRISNGRKKVYRKKSAEVVVLVKITRKDGITTEKFKEDFYNGKINFEEIKEQIRNRKYQPSPVKRVYIPKENGDKRALGIPTVLDRVIQQAIAQVLIPIYEEQFSETSKRLKQKGLVFPLDYYLKVHI